MTDDLPATLTPAMAERLEAAAFRRLVAHLRTRNDAQNIDMMNLAGFCRNCLANWYQDAAKAEGIDIPKAAARELIYGMPYDDWRTQNQRDASPDQLSAYEKNKPKHD